jgi:hypothetical protein
VVYDCLHKDKQIKENERELILKDGEEKTSGPTSFFKLSIEMREAAWKKIGEKRKNNVVLFGIPL